MQSFLPRRPCATATSPTPLSRNSAALPHQMPPAPAAAANKIASSVSSIQRRLDQPGPAQSRAKGRRVKLGRGDAEFLWCVGERAVQLGWDPELCIPCCTPTPTPTAQRTQHLSHSSQAEWNKGLCSVITHDSTLDSTFERLTS